MTSTHRLCLSQLVLILLVLTAVNGCTTSQFLSSGTCYDCDVTCYQCNAGTASDCTACVSTRSLLSDNTCHCIDGYAQASPVSNNCVVISCHYSCLTCNNTASSCLTCSSANYRIYVSGSKTCPCIDKYFDNGASLCVPCANACATCSIISTNCTSCNNLALRSISGNTCPCNIKYFDDGPQLCVACNYKCASCTTSSTNCLTCGANRGATPGCACSGGYYDDGINTDCIVCNNLCKACTNGTACTSCDSVNLFRIRSSTSPFCICMDRYFSNGVPLCVACHPTCFTCTDAAKTSCLTCNATANRLFSSGSCVCVNHFYETNSNIQYCTVCDSRCVTCSTISTNCTSCDGTINRVASVSGTACNCNIGFYENSIATCSPCESSCYTCTNATVCTSCVAATLKTVNSSGLCSCTIYQYYDATNGCQSCNYKCLTCSSSSATACLSCGAGTFRTYTSFTCPCNLHYYDDGVNSNCVACHYSCLTCSGTAATNCLSCNTALGRLFQSGVCICKGGTYDKAGASLEACQPCAYNCLTCTDGATCDTCNAMVFRVYSSPTCICMPYYFQATNLTCTACLYSCHSCNSVSTCITCDATKQRILNTGTSLCGCKPTYYDNLVVETCFSCLPQCATCTNATKCTTCSAGLFRQLSSNYLCPCIGRYWDNAGTCQPCNYYCLTCATASNSCTNCSSSAQRQLNKITKLCDCAVGYYDDGNSHEQCLVCSYACLTCETTSTNCLSCVTTLRTLSAHWCTCAQHFYDNNITIACVACHYSCSTCSVGSQCSTCDGTLQRVFDSVNKYCICNQGYYDNGVQQTCLVCNYSCTSCTNSTACLSCNPAKFRITPSSMCPCVDGYYDTKLSEQLCLACQYTCKTCTVSSSCTSCDTVTNFRISNTSTSLCSCKAKYFDDGLNHQLCQPCVYSCQTCQTTAGNCLTCNATAHRVLSGSDCICMQHYYNSLVQLCSSCHYSCSSCTAGSVCTDCNITNHRQFNTTTGLCSCVPGYFDDLTNRQLCQVCEPSCLVCTNLSACYTCDANRFRRLNATANYLGVSSKYCVCFDRYYDPASNANCLPCHYSCEVCHGGTATNCRVCSSIAKRTFNAATSKCLCQSGYYDDGANELCLACNAACLLCTNSLTTSCTSCNSTNYLFLSRTTCFVTCPDNYFGNPLTMTCDACSANCVHCTDANTCTSCITNIYLYSGVCYNVCPRGSYSNFPVYTCTTCPKGCSDCINGTNCSACYDRYYFDTLLKLCFACNSLCFNCLGPGQNQCTSCVSPLYYNNNQCYNMTCPYGQFVDPIKGCGNCNDKFSNSLTCDFNKALICVSPYLLISGQCVSCTSVTGYMISTTGTCVEICGDGILIMFQCDDGNRLNGDGCSSNCVIESGWSCTPTSPSICQLFQPITMSLTSLAKVPGKNSLNIVLGLSLPILLKQTLTLTVEGATKYNYTVKQGSQLSLVNVELNYQQDINKRNISLNYGQSRLLQQWSQLQPTISRLLGSINFAHSFSLDSFPPANYYPDDILVFYQNMQIVLLALSLLLLIVSLILVPFKMHLHAVTFVSIPALLFICYGLSAQQATDWVKFSTVFMKYAAMIGGVSFGNCCTTQSSHYSYTTEMLNNSGAVVLVLLLMAIIYFIFWVYNRSRQIPPQLAMLEYFFLTLFFALQFHLSYASINTLYNYVMLTALDAFNTPFAIFMLLLTFLVVPVVWIVSSEQVISAETLQPKVFVKNDIDENTDQLEAQSEQKLVDMDARKAEELEKETPKALESSHSDLRSGQIVVVESADALFHGMLQHDYYSLYRPQTLNSKYFLPLHLSKLYLTGILCSLMRSIPLPLFIVLGLLEITYLMFVIVVRPFRSTFTNVRLVIISLLLLAMDTIMCVYLSYKAMSVYLYVCELSLTILLLVVLVLAIVFCIVEHIYAWRHQLWEKIYPCLRNWRIIGSKKVHNDDLIQVQKRVTAATIDASGAKANEEAQLDAFYARMIKRQTVNRKYRQQRFIK